MTLVSTVQVGAGGAASIDFTSIPGTTTDLLLVYSLRGTIAQSYRGLLVQFNSDTGSNYTMKQLYGTGSSAGSTGGTSTSFELRSFPAASATANTFGNGQIYIPNYSGATAKSISSDTSSEDNTTATFESITAGSWSGTSAITSIKLFDTGSNFAQYSTASLYTITKGSGGATVS